LAQNGTEIFVDSQIGSPMRLGIMIEAVLALVRAKIVAHSFIVGGELHSCTVKLGTADRIDNTDCLPLLITSL